MNTICATFIRALHTKSNALVQKLKRENKKFQIEKAHLTNQSTKANINSTHLCIEIAKHEKKTNISGYGSHSWNLFD